MNIAVTGGAGFIGSHIVEYLVNRGDSVTVIDNLHTGKTENLAAVIDQINFIKADIRNIDSLENILKNVDGVFHEAALASVQESFSKPNEYHDVNVNGTENILKLSKKFGFKIVYASSSSVYGNPVDIPIKEDAQKIPVNPYAKTKLDDEILAEKYSEKGVNVIGLRYFNVFGERQSENYAGVIKLFLERIQNKEPPIINGDGSQIRDFVYVKDVVRANILALESNVKNAFINIGTGKTISILELANQIIESSKLSLKPIHKNALEGDVHKSQADVTLAKKLLNWEYKVELKDWLNETVSELIRRN
ncbi:MAG: NAD-dependent epimerase/dehydratase family protein [Nitrosopumilus sp.]|uniref:NAD-dependent epimerase/dehydratase family protein n=1 Tax=Nitrosopumilus sp. TaxID=2024843 RepID=UPI00242B88BB|nr:NAD-dependent epimerase/dehydratase family protein [Nitrosopumilus sp.]MCV0366658.1 NAD-dependent epimerase/dehydratase family protein [Nitrosopumilus sp.]